jgi:GT2 family glycosyltransferase
MDNLRQIHATIGLPEREWELLLVDNASTDGSADAVASEFPHVRLIRLEQNIGMPARNHALRLARGQYVLLLDDDSHPMPGTVPSMLAYMDSHLNTGALAGRVMLSNGRCEASAMPGVFIGCAGMIRRSVLDMTGLFPEEFFRQAEEYDLSCRIWNAGYTIERFEDLEFRHNKVLGGRSSALTVKMDVRNNLILAARYLPNEIMGQYGRDWKQRYCALAKHLGVEEAAAEGVSEAGKIIADPAQLRRQPLSPTAFENLFGHQHQRNMIASWASEHQIRKVVIASYAKGILATWDACWDAGLQIQAMAEDAPAFTGLVYRGVRVMSIGEALQMNPDGIVLANVNPSQVESWLRDLQQKYDGPVLSFWNPIRLADLRNMRRVA